MKNEINYNYGKPIVIVSPSASIDKYFYFIAPAGIMIRHNRPVLYINCFPVFLAIYNLYFNNTHR